MKSQVKPGWQTTEFWTTLLSQGLTLLTLLGVLSNTEAQTLESAASQCITAVFLFLTNCLIVLRYIQARVAVKTQTPWVSAGGSPATSAPVAPAARPDTP